MTIVARNFFQMDGWHKSWVFNSFSLRQSYNDHHVFEINATIPNQDVNKTQMRNPSITKEGLTNILGQDVQIKIFPESNTKCSLSFHGFVDQVTPYWTSRSCMLKIIGYSKTIFMDCVPRFRTFNGLPLTEIVQKILGGYGSKTPGAVFNGPAKSSSFSVQMQETDYRYLCRLADLYGKVFYFDGTYLQFGDLEKKGEETIKLKFAENFKQGSLTANITPLNFRISGFHLESATVLNQSAEPCSNNNFLLSNVIAKSGKYPGGTIHQFNILGNETELKDNTRFLQAKNAIDLVRIDGISDNPSLYPGCKFSISDTPEIIGQGDFIVLEITHQVNSDHSYQNSFTAIPAGFPYPPRMQNIRNPQCGPLMAVVKDHADPDKLGRIRVAFVGDEEKTISPWLRVLTSFTGFGGMYYLPEPGDMVVVHSEDFNIEKSPFVMGAFYHGKAKAEQWFDPKNKKKGFTTEKVAFKIDDRSGKLFIEAEEIEIKARKKFKTQSEESEFESKEKMKIHADKHLILEAKRIDLNP